MFVTWKELDWPFWTAFERCLIAGVAIYSALAVAIAVLLTLARVQPIALLVGPAIRLLSIGIYAVLHSCMGSARQNRAQSCSCCISLRGS